MLAVEYYEEFLILGEQRFRVKSELPRGRRWNPNQPTLAQYETKYLDCSSLMLLACIAIAVAYTWKWIGAWSFVAALPLALWSIRLWPSRLITFQSATRLGYKRETELVEDLRNNGQPKSSKVVEAQVRSHRNLYFGAKFKGCTLRTSRGQMTLYKAAFRAWDAAGRPKRITLLCQLFDVPKHALNAQLND
jgi:hypothetical protein